MNQKRINSTHKVFLLSASGTRTPVDAHSIVIEFEQSHYLELDLTPSPKWSDIAIYARSKIEGVHPILILRPGAANVVSVSIENYSSQTTEKKSGETNTDIISE